MWNQYLTSKLVDELNFEQSSIDLCVFYQGSTIFICYTDDGIALDLNGNNLLTFVKEIEGAKLKVEDMSHLNDYVGVNIQRKSNETFHFVQNAPPPSVVGIDLHHSALALEGDCARKPSPALLKIRGADALVFGYESAGIPDTLGEEISEWVQIPSRSSINVVAAMSIVLDAMLV